MNLPFRRRPLLCATRSCDRVASVAVSHMGLRAVSCHLHIARYERVWGQVFVKGLR